MPRKVKKPKVTLGPLTLRALNGEPGAWRWRVEWYPQGAGGKMRTRSLSRVTGERFDKAEAIARATELLGDGIHLMGEPAEPDDCRTVDTVLDLLEAWLGSTKARVGGDLRESTWTNYRVCSARLAKLPLARVALDAVQADHCSRAVTALRRRYSDSTASQTLLALRMAWRWAVAEGILNRSFPGKVWLKSAGPQHMPTVDDVRATLVAMREMPTRNELRRAQAVLAVQWMLYTGARPGEVALTCREDIDLRRGSWQVREGEGSKTGARVVPLNPALVAAINTHIAQHPPDPASDSLWPPVIGIRSTTYNWATWIREASQEAGVRRWTPKGLRHLAVTRMLTAGIDVATAASITGHSPEVLLRSYAHVLNDRRSAAVAALELPTEDSGRNK